MMTSFYREYLLEAPDDVAVRRRAISLWCWYYVTTEEFDRSVCAARRDGVAIPVSAFERMLCTRYAYLQMKELTRAAKSFGLSATIMDEAKETACNMKHEQQERWLNVYPPFAIV